MTTAGERPLTARSVVASTLLGHRAAPAAGPARWCAPGALFGIAEGTVRTALSRMVAAGELTADGRPATPSPARWSPARTRQAESRPGRRRPWDGRLGAWPSCDAERRTAAERADLRAATAALRLAELREGVWLRPDNLDPTVCPRPRAVVPDAQCRPFRVRPRRRRRRELAARLWDLDGWADGPTALRRRMARSSPRSRPATPTRWPPASCCRPSVLRHFQADPLLPADLLPADWPGAALRADYDRYDRAFKAAWSAPRLREPSA